MNTRTHSIAATALLIIAAATTGMAQNPTPTPAKMPEHKMDMKDMKGMKDMSAMMAGPHHVLAMAYMDNLATFAQALQGQVTKSNSVDLELARPAVAEMRRSFDQMQQYHQGHMMMMSDSAKAAMSESMRPMETHLRELGEHLTALESAISADTPDPKKVTEHTAAILKQCAGMSAMPAMGQPHHMKP